MKSLQKRKYFNLIFFIFLGLIIQFSYPFSAVSISHVQPLFDKAVEKSNHGDCAGALKDWDSLLEFSPNNSAAISNRGNCLLVLGDFEGAIQAQSRALELSPENAQYYLNRAIAEESLKRFDAAEQDYSWILLRNPNNSLALYNLANVKSSQGEWSQAENLYKKAFLVRSEFVMAEFGQALMKYQLGELDQAKSAMRSIIRKHPMFADARAALSGLLASQGSSGEAKSHWVAAKGLDSRYQEQDWLLEIRKWPPQPVKDLMNFLEKENL